VIVATYRALQDIFDGSAIILAGTTFTISNSWVPPAACDPLDGPAVTAFFNAGPQLCGLIRAQWAGQIIAPPVTRWVEAGNPALQQFKLTGLGAGLGSLPMRGSLP
jgi:hypothetical protein